VRLALGLFNLLAVVNIGGLIRLAIGMQPLKVLDLLIRLISTLTSNPKPSTAGHAR